MKDLDHEDVALLRAGLQALRVRIAHTVSEGAGIPGLVHGAETIDRVRELETALSEPMNHLVTPPAKKSPKPINWDEVAASFEAKR